ncbi:MAG: GWxTD domain-containing protein [Ignavibacteriales bacterium]|nr:MAG: GWxTD domain-containing protein [Ignavibacteriales bacterium]
MKKMFITILFLVSVISAQVEYSTNSRSGKPINFSVDVGGFKSSVPNKTRMDFFVQVPYSSIQFVKKDDGFYANYNITLSFADESKINIIFERTWKERVKTTNFEQTLSMDNFNLSYKTYDLNPGKYFVKCIVEDSDSRSASSKEIPLVVKQISDSLGVSDLMLVSEFVKDSTGEKIIPNVTASVTNRSTSVPLYFEIYSDKTREINIEYSLDDLKNSTSFKQMEHLTVKPGTNLVKHTINNVSFSVGGYLLNAVIKDNDWKIITSVEKKIISKIHGVPSAITDLEKAIQQIIYIASTEELDFIKEGKNYDEKLERFLSFWDKKKPNSKTDDNPILYEYFRRVDYANKHFKGLGEGWHSDMGMIFITFGPPSSVERHPLDSNTKPYEIWDYYELNRTFVFSDQTGFGDYRLVNPDYSRWPGYRP